MHVTIVHVRVRPEHVEDFTEATRRNHEGSVRDPGRRGRGFAGGVAAAHEQTEHHRRSREAVAEWMAGPRQGVRYRGLFPGAAR